MEPPAAAPAPAPAEPALEIAPTDPIVPYFQSAPGAVELKQLELDSPALEQMRAQGITLVVPLVTQGELIGLLNLGPRLSDQEYSPDDRRLLESLAAQVAPAVRVGQLVREQEAEVRARERLEQELEVARLIQQNFLPKELPRAARVAGGGVLPAGAHRRRRLLRLHRAARRPDRPRGRRRHRQGRPRRDGDGRHAQRAARGRPAPARARDGARSGSTRRCARTSRANMFVTCLYGVLDPATGLLRYANAGHNLPIVQSGGGVSELRATGMPLGLMPGMSYEEKEAILAPGASVLLYSDGLDRGARPGAGDVRHRPRARAPGDRAGGRRADLRPARAARPVHRLRRRAGGRHHARRAAPRGRAAAEMVPVLEFSLPSAEGNEREAMRRVGEAAAASGLAPARLERLKTAIAEATMNAMEHGNGFDPDSTVDIVVARVRGRGHRADHRSRRRPRDPARRDPRPRGEARRPPVAARLGPLPDRATWSTRCAPTATSTGTRSSS